MIFSISMSDLCNKVQFVSYIGYFYSTKLLQIMSNYSVIYLHCLDLKSMSSANYHVLCESTCISHKSKWQNPYHYFIQNQTISLFFMLSCSYMKGASTLSSLT
jgi:hypothetical protein